MHLAVFVKRFDVRVFAEFCRRRDGAFVENMRIEFLHLLCCLRDEGTRLMPGPPASATYRRYLARTTLLNLVAKVKDAYSPNPQLRPILQTASASRSASATQRSMRRFL